MGVPAAGLDSSLGLDRFRPAAWGTGRPDSGERSGKPSRFLLAQVGGNVPGPRPCASSPENRKLGAARRGESATTRFRHLLEPVRWLSEETWSPVPPPPSASSIPRETTPKARVPAARATRGRP